MPASAADFPGERGRLSVFARAPVPGAVKTRLVPPLSPAGAAALQRAMTGDLLDRLSGGFGAAPTGSLELRCGGDLSSAPLEIPPGWTAAPQGAGDLGARLERAALQAAGEGVERLVIVGSDAPLLPLPLIEAAFAALRTGDAAIAPAEDGGYVLIGVAAARLPKRSLHRLFSGIRWGTDEVFPATRAAARAAALDLAELPAHWDVDRPDDLVRLRRVIAALPAPSRPRRLEALFNARSETRKAFFLPEDGSITG